MTTSELLDAIEARIAELRRRIELPAPVSNGVHTVETAPDVHWTFPVDRKECRKSGTLQKRMEQAGIAPSELASLFGVSEVCLRDWLSGARPVPSWVLPSMQVMEMLTPEARRNAGKGRSGRREKHPLNPHPFSRIEEL